MATQNQLIMQRSKEQLAGKWGNAAVGTLIFLAIVGAASCTYVGALILQGPLTVGFLIYIASLIYEGKNDFNKIFDGFRNFVNTLVAGLVYSLLVAIGYVLLIVPGVILSCGLSMAFFILIDRPETSGMDALSESWNLMNGHKWEFFCLNCRFIGWALLCVLTCGIGYLWLFPYMYASYCNFYRNLRYGTF